MDCTRNRMVTCLILLVLTMGSLGTAGCIERDAADAPTTLPFTRQDVVALDASAGAFDPQTAVRLTTLGPAEQVFEGTFHVSDVCLAILCHDAALNHHHDISALVPHGLSTQIVAFVVAEPADAEISVVLVSPDHDRDTAVHLIPRGAPDLTVRLDRRAPEPITLMVSYHAPGMAPTVDYRLTVKTDPDPYRLLSGSPLGLELGPDDGFVMGWTNGTRSQSGAFTLYAPDDSLYGRYGFKGRELEVRLPPDAPSGRYVLVTAPWSGGLLFRDVEAKVLAAEAVRTQVWSVATPTGEALAASDTFVTDRPATSYRVFVQREDVVSVRNPELEISRSLRVVLGSEEVIIDAVHHYSPLTVPLASPVIDWTWMTTSPAGDHHPVGPHEWSVTSDQDLSIRLWVETIIWER